MLVKIIIAWLCGGLSSGDSGQVFQDFLSSCFYYGQFFHHQLVPAYWERRKILWHNNKSDWPSQVLFWVNTTATQRMKGGEKNYSAKAQQKPKEFLLKFIFSKRYFHKQRRCRKNRFADETWRSFAKMMLHYIREKRNNEPTIDGMPQW